MLNKEICRKCYNDNGLRLFMNELEEGYKRNIVCCPEKIISENIEKDREAMIRQMCLASRAVIELRRINSLKFNFDVNKVEWSTELHTPPWCINRKEQEGKALYYEGLFTCPRRAETGMDKEGIFKHAGKNKDHWVEVDGVEVCSYCGSLHPTQFLKDVEKGISIKRTTKNYKVYGKNHKKVYFQHFTDIHKKRFIKLLNEKKVVFEGGFEFNPLPYFIESSSS